MPHFVKDVEEIRQRALHKIEDGAVTRAYRGNKDNAIGILNEALATEIVCVLRYMHHYFMATGVHGKSVADEFKEHADAEREHADQIAERIQQLGGKPDFNPRSLLERSASQYVEGESLADMIREDLIAERMVIEVYTDMIRHFGDNDPTTRVMLEGILKDEEEHASDLTDLLYVVDPHTGEAEGQDPGTNPLRIGGDGQRQQQGGGRQQQGARGRDQQAQQQQRRSQQPHAGQSQRGQQAQQGRSQQQSWEEDSPQTRSRENRGQQPRSGQERDRNRGGRGQGRRGGAPMVSQREAGTTFAGSEKPNPPQPIRNRGNRQRGNGGNQPLEPSYFRGENEVKERQKNEQFGGRGSGGGEKRGNREERGGRRRGAA